MSYRRLSLPVFAVAGSHWVAVEPDSPAIGRDFAGRTASGVNETTGLPTEFGRRKNLHLANAAAATGYSSPILVGDRIFLTAYEGEKRVTKQGYVVHDHENC